MADWAVLACSRTVRCHPLPAVSRMHVSHLNAALLAGSDVGGQCGLISLLSFHVVQCCIPILAGAVRLCKYKFANEAASILVYI